MKFSRLDLLTLLISLFIFTACEKTSTIGLEIDPGSAIQGNLIDTLSISSKTITDDVRSTVGLTRYPFGFLQDPVFGTTESSLSMFVGLPGGTAYSFGKTPTLDSAILVLNFGGEMYGDTTLNYSMDVFQLKENLGHYESYESNKEYPINNVLLANRTGRLLPNTKFKITDVVDGKPDTLKTVTPQIRIKLDRDFIQNNILNQPASKLLSNLAFADHFKGLHLKINKNGSTGNGGIMFFDFAGSASNLSLYYRNVDTVKNIPDTINVNFPMGEKVYPVAATVKHDYTGTPVETQLKNPNQQYEVTYLQPLAGLKNKISFPYLNKFAKDIGKIAINKAELVIKVSANSDAAPFYAAPRLGLYRYDIAERRAKLPDNSPESDLRGIDATLFGGYFDSVKKQYVFTVTAYIQDLINGKTKDYGTFLAPIPTNEAQITPSLSSAARAIVGANKKNALAGDQVMKLNIYYTKIN